MAGMIFLNYRRSDDAGTVLALYGRLEQAFGRDAIFMDVEGYIKAGDDYVDVLRAQVADCDVLLAVIGPRWLSIPDEQGRRRLDNPEDWVRVEIVSALEAGSAKRVIPVLVGGAAMPRAEDLPDNLQRLARKQAVRITLERFKSDVQGLVDQVTGVFADIETARTTSAAEQAAAKATLAEKEKAEAERAAAVFARGAAERAAGMSADDVRKAEELANWEFIKGRDSVDDLRDHLARFPGGPSERWARERLSQVLWASFGARGTAEQLKAYLDEFPASAHFGDAHRRIADHEAAKKERAEAKAWRAKDASAGNIARPRAAKVVEARLAKQAVVLRRTEDKAQHARTSATARSLSSWIAAAVSPIVPTPSDTIATPPDTIAEDHDRNLWYIARDGKQSGPISETEIKAIAAHGYFRPTDLVWRWGFAEWRPALAVFMPSASNPRKPSP